MGIFVLCGNYNRPNSYWVFVEKLGTTRAIKIGIAISLVGFLILIIPFYPYVLCPVGIALIGFGFAPLYPCVMQDTPLRFGSFAMIATGYQMVLPTSDTPSSRFWLLWLPMRQRFT